MRPTSRMRLRGAHDERGFRRAAVGKPALGHDPPDSVYNRGHDLRGRPLTGPYLGAVNSTAGRPHYHVDLESPASPLVPRFPDIGGALFIRCEVPINDIGGRFHRMI